jgi:hypothetical protein
MLSLRMLAASRRVAQKKLSALSAQLSAIVFRTTPRIPSERPSKL